MAIKSKTQRSTRSSSRIGNLMKKTPGKSKSPTPQERHQLVQEKAYEIYEQRGRQDGNDWSDWFEAEDHIGLD